VCALIARLGGKRNESREEKEGKNYARNQTFSIIEGKAVRMCLHHAAPYQEMEEGKLMLASCILGGAFGRACLCLHCCIGFTDAFVVLSSLLAPCMQSSKRGKRKERNREGDASFRHRHTVHTCVCVLLQIHEGPVNVPKPWSWNLIESTKWMVRIIVATFECASGIRAGCALVLLVVKMCLSELQGILTSMLHSPACELLSSIAYM